MEYNNEIVNRLMNESILIADEVASIYHYPDNITHLLYVIIPAFILKYGMKYKELLKKCFYDIPIMIQDEKNQIYQAYYFSIPKREKNKIITDKGIVLKNYENIGLMQLLDNLCHEFNHAINSIQNEVVEGDYLKIRTGIAYHYFNKKDLSFVKKSDEIILEEVINTKQTEMIINIIKDFSTYSFDHSAVQSTLYSIHHSFDHDYHSNSYLLESYICQELLKNRTFISTLEVLRFEGQVEDIHHFFDDIVGKDGAFLSLCRYLNESFDLQKKLVDTKWFQKRKIEKIKEINKKAFEIIQCFHQNTIYK